MKILSDPDMAKPRQNVAATIMTGQRCTMKPCGTRRQAHDPVDIVALLRPLVDRGRELVSNKSVCLEFVHDEAQNVSVFDENKFFQIAACLMQNAVHSTSRGTIAVIATRERCWFRLTVTDTGRGDAGTGGLIMARKLSGLLGGSLAVASKAGEGTIAQVSLPVLFLTGKDVTAVPLEVVVNGRRYAAD
jgi:signal transduction histidine kinase